MHGQKYIDRKRVLQAVMVSIYRKPAILLLNNVTMPEGRKYQSSCLCLNSDNITINDLKYKDSAEVLAMVQGERTKAVSILNTDVTKAKQKLNAGFGITDAAIQLDNICSGAVDTKKKKTKAKANE